MRLNDFRRDVGGRRSARLSGGVPAILMALVLGAAVLVAGGALAPAAGAASAAIGVTYPSEPVQVKAGETTTVSLKVANVGQKPLSVEITQQRVKLLDNGQTRFLAEPDPMWTDRVTIDPQELKLDGRSQKPVKVTIRVPAAARPDDYFLGFMVTPVITSGQIRTVNAVGALVVIDVPGPRGASISASYGDMSGLTWGSHVDGVIHVHNTGVSSVTFTTDARISGWVAPKPGEVRAQPYLLPTKLSRDIPFHFSSWLGLGRYTVTTTLVYNKTSQKSADVVITRTLYVVSPWWLLLPVGIIALVTLIVWLRVRGRRRKRALDAVGMPYRPGR